MTGPLKNPRHERFAQELARGKSQTDAYAVAGYKPNAGAACRLAENVKIVARVAEILGVAATLAHIDAAWVLKKAVALHEKALGAGAYASAKGALDLIGKHVEVQAFREQVQHSGRIEFANLSDDELEARITALTNGAYVPRLTAH